MSVNDLLTIIYLMITAMLYFHYSHVLTVYMLIIESLLNSFIVY